MSSKKIFTIVFGCAGMAFAFITIILGILVYSGVISPDMSYLHFGTNSEVPVSGSISALEDIDKNLCVLGVKMNIFAGLLLIVAGGLSFFAFGLKLAAVLNEKPRAVKPRVSNPQQMAPQFYQNIPTPPTNPYYSTYPGYNAPEGQVPMTEWQAPMPEEQTPVPEQSPNSQF